MFMEIKERIIKMKKDYSKISSKKDDNVIKENIKEENIKEEKVKEVKIIRRKSKWMSTFVR